jgi:predicted dehydrogenase
MSNQPEKSSGSQTSRRQFLSQSQKVAGAAAAVSTLSSLIAPNVHAASTDTVQVALIGCGGRGTGAAANALSLRDKGPIKLVAMADVFDNRLKSSFTSLSKAHPTKVDVPQDRKFIGFDGYKKAMDCLKPGDIAIFTTPLAFRWVHFTYAIEKKLHVFMEKPLTADGPTSRLMIELAKKASAKNLKVGVGLMSRHSRALEELHGRIQDGEIGDIIAMRGYRMSGPVASCFSNKWPGTPSELLWQISRFHSFPWLSGGCFNDYYIHIVDHLCWMKNAWPVKAQAVGGRHYRGNHVDQNFDSYSVEYTFDDGAKLFMDGRCMAGAEQIYTSHIHGSKGLAIGSKRGDCGLPSSTYKGQLPDKANQLWQSSVKISERNPYVNEWNDLLDAIRNDKPYNEVERGVYASLTCSLGRYAAHTGKEVTLKALLESKNVLAPGVEKLTMESPPPLKSDKDGKYPVPQPGIVTDREY